MHEREEFRCPAEREAVISRRNGRISSVVERLLYTQLVGGSNPSSCMIEQPRIDADGRGFSQILSRNPRTESYSFRSPSSNRVLIVPSGVLVVIEISRWLMPLKKARSMACR